ncbi:bone marrow stromal antigen 2-like isoform X2 [Myotis daubentonii]|uniref:bone marrow stromal antigen 2-like isoform X2 n=1 Tax=Myotis daubentonii TaxID=98922 RepID=UPI0028732D55|nr:bone marrow stromal antigen 2-like isoform X2 [Myotis daubentonii]
MAPTSCCYSRVPTDEFPKNLEDRKLPVWVGILLGLLVVGLSVAVGVLAAKANSSACKDGLQAEQECRNHTHLLEQELTRAQEVLRGTEAQAATCNQTVGLERGSGPRDSSQAHQGQEPQFATPLLFPGIPGDPEDFPGKATGALPTEASRGDQDIESVPAN